MPPRKITEKSRHPQRAEMRPRKASAQGHAPPSNLRQDILRLLAERPLDKVEISQALNLAPALRTKLLGLLRDMELAGDVARIRKDRFIIPQVADLFTGSIGITRSTR
jgi:hypothetical protein